jgi:pyridinium-3,5-biscarboxylic acid mononucleotide synthase
MDGQMNTDDLKVLLEKIRDGKIDVNTGIDQLRNLSYIDLGCAKIDTHRELRVGHPEVIFCQGKTTQQIVTIIRAMKDGKSNILATRAGEEVFNAVRDVCPAAVYNPLARTISLKRKKMPKSKNYIAIVTAGTSDLPIAEEAAVTAEMFGNRVERVIDVGVAGVHRLFDKLDIIRGARVIIVVAGMEGALPSVVGGLVDKPIIAVPTSIGYGASFQGVAALLSMLNSCAGGVSVVNIDNGFGAGCMASKINKLK